MRSHAVRERGAHPPLDVARPRVRQRRAHQHELRAVEAGLEAAASSVLLAAAALAAAGRRVADALAVRLEVGRAFSLLERHDELGDRVARARRRLERAGEQRVGLVEHHPAEPLGVAPHPQRHRRRRDEHVGVGVGVVVDERRRAQRELGDELAEERVHLRAQLAVGLQHERLRPPRAVRRRLRRRAVLEHRVQHRHGVRERLAGARLAEQHGVLAGEHARHRQPLHLRRLDEAQPRERRQQLRVDAKLLEAAPPPADMQNWRDDGVRRLRARRTPDTTESRLKPMPRMVWRVAQPSRLLRGSRVMS